MVAGENRLSTLSVVEVVAVVVGVVTLPAVVLGADVFWLVFEAFLVPLLAPALAVVLVDLGLLLIVAEFVVGVVVAVVLLLFIAGAGRATFTAAGALSGCGTVAGHCSGSALSSSLSSPASTSFHRQA